MAPTERLTVLLLLIELIAAPRAHAQARVMFVPSVSFSSVYDNNLFSRPVASGDLMNQVTPSVETDWESPRLSILSLASFDMQRAVGYSTLNTFDARRHLFVGTNFRAWPKVTLSFDGRYDRSQTPGELNVETGLLGARQLADRWEATPYVLYRPNGRTSLTGQYDWTSESYAHVIKTNMQVARGGVSRAVSPLDAINVSYLGRSFTDGIATERSHAALAGWTRELAPATSFTLQAGPRLTSYAGVEPEIVASFVRATPVMSTLVDFWDGETIVLGVRGPVSIQSATSKLMWPVERRVEIGAHLGVFRSSAALDQAKALVYHGGLVAAWSPGGLYTIAASYGVDYQLGDVRSPKLSDRHILRHVFLVRVTVAPRFSRSFLSPDEAARAKGVTP